MKRMRMPGCAFSVRRSFCLLAVVLLLSCLLLGSCSDREAAQPSDTTTAVTTVAEAEDEAETVTKSIAGAKIIGSDALALIESFSAEQLGLIGKESYKFVVGQQAVTISGIDYVEVIAAKMAKNVDGTYAMDQQGFYYISFDGTTILKKDVASGRYTELVKNT